MLRPLSYNIEKGIKKGLVSCSMLLQQKKTMKRGPVTKFPQIKFESLTRMLRRFPIKLASDLWRTDCDAAMCREHGGPAMSTPPSTSLSKSVQLWEPRIHTVANCPARFIMIYLDFFHTASILPRKSMKFL